MPTEWILILAAVAAGWVVQLLMAYRQSTSFSHAVRTLRRSGTVSVGVAGKRYRGGRAFVAIAVDDHGIVRDALSLRGFTTFARAKPLPTIVGLKLSQVIGDREVPGLAPHVRASAREAAVLYRKGIGTMSADPSAGATTASAPRSVPTAVAGPGQAAV